MGTTNTTSPASYLLPFVSVNDDDQDARFPVTVYPYSGRECELDDDTCTKSNVRFADYDDNSPQFCFKHFHDIHAARRQSHVEPMNAEELAIFLPDPDAA